MDWYAGIDGSLEASCVCLVDDAGKIIREGSERSGCYLRHAEGEDEEFSSATLEFATIPKKKSVCAFEVQSEPLQIDAENLMI